MEEYVPPGNIIQVLSINISWLNNPEGIKTRYHSRIDSSIYLGPQIRDDV